MTLLTKPLLRLLLFVLPVCAAANIASIATREAGTGAAGSAVRVGFVSEFEGMVRPASLRMLQTTAPAQRYELLCDSGLEKGCTQGSVPACDAAYLGGPSKHQHSAVQTTACQVMIERRWHVIAGLSSR